MRDSPFLLKELRDSLVEFRAEKRRNRMFDVKDLELKAEKLASGRGDIKVMGVKDFVKLTRKDIAFTKLQNFF